MTLCVASEASTTTAGVPNSTYQLNPPLQRAPHLTHSRLLANSGPGEATGTPAKVMQRAGGMQRLADKRLLSRAAVQVSAWHYITATKLDLRRATLCPAF